MGVSRRMPPSTTNVARSIRAAFTVGRRSHGPKSPQFYGFHGNPPLRAALSCATQRARMRAAKRCARGKQSGVRTGGCVHDCGCTSGCARGAYGVCDGAVSAHTTRTPPSPPHPHRSRPLPSLYFPTGCSCLPPPPPRQNPQAGARRVAGDCGSPEGGGGNGGGTQNHGHKAVPQLDSPLGVTQRLTAIRGGSVPDPPSLKSATRCVGGGGSEGGGRASQSHRSVPGWGTR